MADKFRYYDFNQDFLLPPSLREWLPEGHLSYFVSDVVESLDLSDIVSSYQSRTGTGAPAVDPRLMLKLLFYGYCLGIRSSRKIERASYEDIAFRLLAADQHPDHDTIASFRKRHLAAIEELFVQVLRLCQQAGLVKLGLVALDGTKVKASANKSKSRTYEQLMKSESELEDEVKRILDEAEAQDRRENEKVGRGKRGEELPEAFRQHDKRLKKIQQLLKQIEAEGEDEKKRIEQERKQRQIEARRWEEETGQKLSRVLYPRMRATKDNPEVPCSRRNPTDYDSRIMKGSGGIYLQAYNCQAVVDHESQIIVAEDVVNHANDKQLSPPMVEKVRLNLGERPTRLTADTDYYSESDIAALERVGVRCYIPPADNVRYGERRVGGRTITERMRRKLGSRLGRCFYRRRKTVVEPVFGQVKEQQRFRQFLVRGLEQVKGEWALVTLCHNLRKLHLATLN